MQRGIFSAREMEIAMIGEAEMLNDAYQRCFPGFTSYDDGIIIDHDLAAETMRNWLP